MGIEISSSHWADLEVQLGGNSLRNSEGNKVCYSCHKRRILGGNRGASIVSAREKKNADSTMVIGVTKRRRGRGAGTLYFWRKKHSAGSPITPQHCTRIQKVIHKLDERGDNKEKGGTTFPSHDQRDPRMPKMGGGTSAEAGRRGAYGVLLVIAGGWGVFLCEKGW